MLAPPLADWSRGELRGEDAQELRFSVAHGPVDRVVLDEHDQHVFGAEAGIAGQVLDDATVQRLAGDSLQRAPLPPAGIRQGPLELADTAFEPVQLSLLASRDPRERLVPRGQPDCAHEGGAGNSYPRKVF